MKRLVFIFCFNLAAVNLLFAQGASDYHNLESERPTDSRKMSLDRAAAESQSVKFSGRKKFYEGKLSKEQKKQLAPAQELVTKYGQFLKTPETGIVKILSDPKCEENVLDVGNLKCVNALPIYGNGAHYSFSKKTHTKFNTAEIALADNIFRVGFLENFSSLIVDLGDRDIVSVDENNIEAKVLRSIVPIKIYSKFPAQKRVLDQGIFFHGKQYKTDAPAEINHTYILRSVRYYTVYYFMNEYYYDDITVVFRVVERDPAGNMILLWRKLAQKKNVHLKK